MEEERASNDEAEALDPLLTASWRSCRQLRRRWDASARQKRPSRRALSAEVEIRFEERASDWDGWRQPGGALVISSNVKIDQTQKKSKRTPTSSKNEEEKKNKIF